MEQCCLCVRPVWARVLYGESLKDTRQREDQPKASAVAVRQNRKEAGFQGLKDTLMGETLAR